MVKQSALLLILVVSSFAPAQGAQNNQDPGFPYTPSLDLTAMDKSVDACVDFYQYACGGWQSNNPIPPDQTSWDVYRKLYEDNLKYLRSILEQAGSVEANPDVVTRRIGDFYTACMDELTVEKRGLAPLKTDLNAISRVRSERQLAQIVGRLQLTYGSAILFRQSSTQDPDNSEQQIAELDQGGLGLPDRDYYTKDDDKTKEIQARYVQHVERVFELMGDDAGTAKRNASTIMTLETLLAKASMTRVDRRDPYKLKHKMNLAELSKLAPKFDWAVYYKELHYPSFEIVNVAPPDFFRELNVQLERVSVANWKAYLRYRVVDSASPYLSSTFAEENFNFYRKYLRGVEDLQPRWKRCVQYTDGNLGEALGQIYVRKTFGPEAEARTLDMVRRIEDAMSKRIRDLDWMSPETKQQALEKLAGIRNKIGHPQKWRDYSSVRITRDDFRGNVARASEFERRRQINKVGKPVDRGEWQMTPPTVNAYYDPQMNDINFPAGVLQPPLFDAKLDDAPNYGNTGGIIGHELTHGFDDEGRQFDAKGNLKDWWTKADAAEFEKRAACISNQYSQYSVVDDIKINGKLTLGEDTADLGGLRLAYMAWKDETKNQKLEPLEGFTPEQRFFIAYGQSWCGNTRDETKRLRATVDPHSPDKYRTNGVVSNTPEFQEAFHCKAGAPMVRENRCRVW